VLPGPAQHRGSKCDPALINAVALGRAWLTSSPPATPDQREGISRRYIRCLVSLGLLSSQLVGAILRGQKLVALIAARLTELNLSRWIGPSSTDCSLLSDDQPVRAG
jgi:hypothetical protein